MNTDRADDSARPRPAEVEGDASEYGGYRRDESTSERLDRNFSEQLQELRVAQAGVQILFAFLLSLAFQARFTELDGFELVLYLVTLVAAALAVVCFTGPVAAHRLLFRRGVKDFLVRYTSRMAVAGLSFLAAAVLGGVMLVVDVLQPRWLAFTIGGGLLAVGLVVWVLIPMSIRRRTSDPDPVGPAR
ncbi:DUF6328 family protein [Nakamurella aerolata]|uniref:DUF6328 family protein n=1 Tax=Nakamurella aerolata TaxID=1656892 RepID=UPI001BB14C83